MAKKSYAQKLRDPRWQKKRLEILTRDDWSCFWCGDKETTLHVHHEVYIGENPWDTPDECLTTLCEDCHAVDHLPLTELEKTLLGALRSRDQHNTQMVKIINRVVTRMANDRSLKRYE